MLTPLIKKMIILVVSVLILSLILWLCLYLISPTRQLKQTLAGFETHQIEPIYQNMSPDLSSKKKLELDELIQDILSAQNISTQIESDEAWREQGETITPTPRYIASHYRARVLFTLNDIPMEVVFHFQRQNTEDEYRFSSFVFKPWIITNIKVPN